MKHSTNIKLVNGQIKIEHLFDFTDKHKEALLQLSEGMFEFRGKATQEDFDINTELSIMGLCDDVEDAWHPSYVINDEGRKVVEQFPIKEAEIKETVEEGFWYSKLNKQTFKVNPYPSYSELRESFYGMNVDLDDALIVSEGEFKGNGILKKHCILKK